MAVNLITLYANVLTKQLVSQNGSPTTVPDQYYGDKPAFIILPVVPVSNNPLQGYTAVNLAGYTMNLTMADTPNATTPPTPFASLGGMIWNGALSGFTGILDLTQNAVKDFLGTAATKSAYFNVDVFDAALNRTTLNQSRFNVVPSIDAPAAGPAGPGVQYLTLQQALNLFVQIGAIPGKQVIFQSEDGTQTRQLTLGNDGTDQWNPL